MVFCFLSSEAEQILYFASMKSQLGGSVVVIIRDVVKDWELSIVNHERWIIQEVPTKFFGP